MTAVTTLRMSAVTANEADVDPGATVTEVGTLAPMGDAFNAMVAPPPGAGDVSVTVQVDPISGVRNAALHEMPLNCGI